MVAEIGPINLLLKIGQAPAKRPYQEIADGGHLLNTEKPYELAQAIKEFVAGF